MTEATTSHGAELAEALGGAVRGAVRFDDAARALYARDASNYEQIPIGVVHPVDADDVAACLAVCRAHEAPVLTRGAGTSLAGQGVNAAVVLDFRTHMNRVLEIDPERGIARAQPGVVVDDLCAAAAPHGLTFGPDPATHAWCTLGGMLGNNACGVHSLTAGRTADNVEALEAITYDGTRLSLGPCDPPALAARKRAAGRAGLIHQELDAIATAHAERIRARYPAIPRRVSGYNLDELLPENGFHTARALVGTEGTCAVILEATLRLVPRPAHRALVAIGYPEIAAAGDDVPALRERGPTALEGMDRVLVDNMRAKGLHPEGLSLLPAGDAWLFVEFGDADPAEALAPARRLVAAIEAEPGHRAVAAPLTDPAAQRRVWATRESGLGASARLADGTDTHEGWEDAAVAPERLGPYLRDLGDLIARHGYRSTFYGHFGQGLVHARIDFDLDTAPGVARYRAFVEEAADLVIRYGGSLSGEHGDGQSRGELLEKMFGPELVSAFRRFKRAWDPDNRMNPGKVVDPAPLDVHLHRGPAHQWASPPTHFRFPDDAGSFGRAAGRCIGVGKCTREGGGTMCPSYMATRDETHSTRGRARLLGAMLDGELPDGFGNESVREALDLCLSCKGCKAECPAGVDLATYKAEFFAHHYAGRPRPRSHYAFGLLPWWARLAGLAPAAANALAATRLGKRMAGMAPEREAPRFARTSFRRRFRRRRPANEGAPAAVLFADTFTDRFEPGVGEAAADVLERAGWRVVVPRGALCCGRPLYDFGMLEAARELLAEVLESLAPRLRAGEPVVVLEPSCAAVFRDELPNLMPEDPDAARLRAQTHTLAELLRAHGFEAPPMRGGAVFHGHCHHEAIMGTEADRALIADAGLRVEAPETGCCGMAGSFGFDARHYAVSQAIGERGLLPAARDTARGDWLITDGFSCREQVRQATGRRPAHLAELLARGCGGRPG